MPTIAGARAARRPESTLATHLLAIGALLVVPMLATGLGGCTCEGDGRGSGRRPAPCRGPACPDGGAGNDEDAGGTRDASPGEDDAGPQDAGPQCSQPCGGETPFCEIAGDRCVECLIDDHCEDRRRSRCQEDFICGPCTADAQCKEMDFRDCDEIQEGGSGICVECTPGNGELFCRGFSCDDDTFRCAGRSLESVPPCGRCRTNRECLRPEDDCVAMTYDGTRLMDGFCLPPADLVACARPIPNVSDPRPFLGGSRTRPYCVVEESLASCAALFDYGSLCDTDADCGEGLGDGFCERDDAGVGRCRSFCRNEDDCPLETVCDGDGRCVPLP
ncbi:MAG TPA: hypothetical protein RMF84_08475 [Polyangiaceae bacterium LLY-WYZ-14_1]|nr:hypothetical protein [Polyangiaceae bacterium LLY-WYZ-14_1]